MLRLRCANFFLDYTIHDTSFLFVVVVVSFQGPYRSPPKSLRQPTLVTEDPLRPRDV